MPLSNFICRRDIRQSSSAGAETVIGLLDHPGFERARSVTTEFDAWNTYEDYVDEMEGWLVGLSSAGQPARLAPVTVAGFLSWRLHVGVEPSVARLDDFAVLIEAFRRNPCAEVEGRIVDKPSCIDGAPREGRLCVPVALRLYQDWLACVGLEHRGAHFDVYARLLLEMWAQFP